MFAKKLFTILLIYVFLLAGCAGKQGASSGMQVGPQTSTSIQNQEQKTEEPAKTTRQRPDVIIPVFDPGLPADPADYQEENIWPELRRAEANRFALHLKEALDVTGQFGAVRVTPDATATGDIYVLGKIDTSTGEEVEITIELVDISGREWFDESYEYEVAETFYQDQRNEGKDPYMPIFEEIARDIVDELEEFSDQELAELHYLSDIRFGAGFSDAAFNQHMEMHRGQISLVSKPNDQDPMYQRIKAIRVRDQLFIDNFQGHYTAFSAQMDESYLMWQEQSYLEIQAQRAARNKTIGNAVGGVLLVGIAVLSAVAGADSNSSVGTAAGTTGAILGGIAGTKMIEESFRTSEEAQVHREALNELGQSIDMELSPQVIAFEEQTVELTGDAKEQFSQWRAFLQKIYEQEKTPDLQL